MQDPTNSLSAGLDAFRLAHFSVSDVLRRAQGDAIGALGLNPDECRHDVIASGPYWRLRAYGNAGRSRPLLVVVAPIKRLYIWDLPPSTSAIRFCLQQGLEISRCLRWRL